MRFNSLEFGVFIAIVIALASVLEGRRRNILFLVASYVFYGSWNAPFVLLLWFTTFLDYFLGLQIGGTQRIGARRAYLAASLVGNLGVLFYFKYGNFFLDNIAFISGVNPEPFYLHVIIPLGISFYTFQSMSYTIDVYRRASEPCRDFVDFALYVAFFPQLIAGPILRAGEFIPQLHRADPVRIEEKLKGVELFLLGLFKKVVIADNFAYLADSVFGSPASYRGPAIALGAIGFAIQIYCDFSGYSTMARGLASFFGFRFPKNFDYPLLRWNPILLRGSWHITMARWFQDYVFVPLGGSKKGDLRFFLNLVLVWTLLGLWHGASWHFVAWGFNNGVQNAIYAVTLKRKKWGLPAFRGKRFLGWFVMISLWIPSAIFFRSGDLTQALAMLRRVVTGAPGIGLPPAWFAITLLLGAVHLLAFRHYDENLLARLGWAGRISVVTAVVLAMTMLAATSRPFIYFQF